ncbi:MAG: type I methionyl aminopeptidase [Planctomycetota bacterium]|nr:MAG: type I methionyl aminopeptidase [Planctomycetota bacterium]
MSRTAAKVVLKSPREIELLRDAGRLVHDILDEIEDRIRPGVTTAELDHLAAQRIDAAGATALFRGVENPQAAFPFPASICSSVNEEVVHGIPDDRPLEEGDIVSVDCGVRLKGYCGDSARTFAVGRVDDRTRKLLDVTREALALAIREAAPGRRWSEIAGRIQQYVESHGFGVVREFVGHGIGREMHEEPKVPNFVDRNAADFELTPGLVLAIEPMVTAGRPEVEFRDSARWSVVTKDRSRAAHFEHAVAIREDGATVLSDGR